jgi:hypothetical protein
MFKIDYGVGGVTLISQTVEFRRLDSLADLLILLNKIIRPEQSR